MLKGPDKCTPCGSYSCSIPLPIGGRVYDVDFCIVDIVAALNAGGVPTVASCCGHGEDNARIDLLDGRVLRIANLP